MTPQEFATEHGLSVEEAELVLAVRGRVKSDPADRLGRAKAALEAAQKRVGVHPVVEGFDELVQAHDPEAEVGLKRFYGRKTTTPDEPVPWVPDYEDGGME